MLIVKVSIYAIERLARLGHIVALSFALVKFRSILNKLSLAKGTAVPANLDIICITEFWLNEGKASRANSVLGYPSYRGNRNCQCEALALSI